MTKKAEFEHGGARENAGRKAQFSEPTKVIRVPESQAKFIKNWLLKKICQLLFQVNGIKS